MKNTILSLGLVISLAMGFTACKSGTQKNIQYTYTTADQLKADLAKVGVTLTIDPSVENDPIVQTQLQCLVGASDCTGFNSLSASQQTAFLETFKAVKEVVVTLSPSKISSGTAKILRLLSGGSVVPGGLTTLSGSTQTQQLLDPKNVDFSFSKGVLTLPLTYYIDSSSITYYDTSDATVFKSISTDTDTAFVQGLENGTVTYGSQTAGDGQRHSDGYYWSINSIANLISLLN